MLYVVGAGVSALLTTGIALVRLPVAKIGARARGLTGEGRGDEREGESGGGEEMHCKRV
jgi:hypothetical protein